MGPILHLTAGAPRRVDRTQAPVGLRSAPHWNPLRACNSGCDMRERLTSLPLFWRLFCAYAAVLLLAFAALVLAPVTVSVPVALRELIVLLVGLVALVALTFVLLRPLLAPFRTLTETMRSIDP